MLDKVCSNFLSHTRDLLALGFRSHRIIYRSSKDYDQLTIYRLSRSIAMLGSNNFLLGDLFVLLGAIISDQPEADPKTFQMSSFVFRSFLPFTIFHLPFSIFRFATCRCGRVVHQADGQAGGGAESGRGHLLHRQCGCVARPACLGDDAGVDSAVGTVSAATCAAAW